MPWLLTMAFVLIAGFAQAHPRQAAWWSDVTTPGYYYLMETLSIGGASFFEGEKFQFAEIIGGGGYVPVTSFKLKADRCRFPDETAEMILLTPGRGMLRDLSVGVILERDCHLIFYVEDAILATPSFFSESSE